MQHHTTQLRPSSGSNEVLSVPDEFGAGISYDDPEVPVSSSSRLQGQDKDRAETETPSLSHALSDLHHAVSGHLSGFKSSLTGSGSGGGKDGSRRRPNVTTPGIFTDVETHSSDGSANASAVSEEIIAPARQSFGERIRVGKCTIIFGGAAIYERAVRTHELHDRMHGYPLHVLRHGILDDVWSKPAYVLSLLLRELSKPEGERLQWLLWVDADTILLNPHIPIETFLPPSPEFDDVHLVISRDWNGLNNGVFPVRVCQWAVDLFSAIVAFRHYRPEENLVFRDQSAMNMLLIERKFAMHTVAAPQRWFNAYQGEHNETLSPFQVRRGDFLVHFAGVIERNERMGYWLDRVEQHLPDWELEVQKTSYPQETRDFWAEQRAERKKDAATMSETRSKAMDLLLKTDSQMAEYQTRLQNEESSKIFEKQAALRGALEKPDLELQKLNAAISELSEVSVNVFCLKYRTN